MSKPTTIPYIGDPSAAMFLTMPQTPAGKALEEREAVRLAASDKRREAAIAKWEKKFPSLKDH